MFFFVFGLHSTFVRSCVPRSLLRTFWPLQFSSLAPPSHISCSMTSFNFSLFRPLLLFSVSGANQVVLNKILSRYLSIVSVPHQSHHSHLLCDISNFKGISLYCPSFDAHVTTEIYLPRHSHFGCFSALFHLFFLAVPPLNHVAVQVKALICII